MRIREVREEKGMTQTDLAKRMGTTQQNIQRWETEQVNMRAETLVRMSRVLGKSVAYLLGVAPEGMSPIADEYEVPLYESIAAGMPIEMIPVNETFAIPGSLHDRYPKAFLLKVAGESMNRILPNGSYALIDPCETVDEDGRPYAVRIDHRDATIKRVHMLAHGVQLIPDSNDPTYHPMVYDDTDPDSDDVAIIGRVVWYCIPYDWQF